MKHQAFNPYLPNYEYIPDAEPHVFDGRVYIYGSHDKFNGASFCLNDYVTWSAPVDDLSDWRFEGYIFRRLQDPKGTKSMMKAMYAPDVCKGPDGKYYLYYFIGYTGLISVAVCDTPGGEFKYIGHVHYADGTLLGEKKEPLQFDPGVFVDDDGKIYMYTGFGPVNYPGILLGGHKPSAHGAMGFELESDMLTIKQGPTYIGVKGKVEGKGTPYEGHEFFEASSMRKINGTYYFIYSSFEGHELCYAMSDHPLSGFRFGGTLVSNGDVGIDGKTKKDAVNYIGNTHGSILTIGDDHYVFYHRQTNRNQFSRQACAEKIEILSDGTFKQAEMTSCGLNGKPLLGEGTYDSAIACNLYSKKGAYWYNVLKKAPGIHPYFTQYGKDREENPNQHIANFCDGAHAVYKYFDTRETKHVSVEVKGKMNGVILVQDKKGNCLAKIELKNKKGISSFEGEFKNGEERQALDFTFQGKGHFDFLSFTLTK